MHYRPRTAILNNLEFDHADIFSDLAAIETQFHHLVRTIPQTGLVLANGSQQSLDRVIERGLWSPLERFGSGNSEWSFEDMQNADGKGGADFAVLYQARNARKFIGQGIRV